ncbi:MAG: ATP-binding protein [Pseudomonadota bacterium]
MFKTTQAFVAALVLILCGVSAAHAQTVVRRNPVELAQAVERRSAATDFAALEAFGRRAMEVKSRESLNRLYHVTWIFLNQGEFEKATLWNNRLASAAADQKDARYVEIARLNALAIRYDDGDTAAAADMARTARTATDWFVKAHATRLTALSLMDDDHIGDGLKLLADVDAVIPDADPYAATARAGLWEVTGIGLMKLNDIEGATAAFGRFEIDFSNPAYPRPDFDAVYNLARLSVQLGDQTLAEQLYQVHHRLAVRSNLESLLVYDANLCAAVAQGRRDPRGVLNCLAPYGHDLGAAAFLAPRLLPLRAVAYAQTGQVAAARADLAEIRRQITTGAFREGASEIPHVEAEILFAEGRHREAFTLLRVYHQDERVLSAKRFSAGIRQVTGDMQNQLAERRQQLETARANTTLQADVIRSQNWIVGIAVVFFLSAVAMVFWQRRLTARLRVAQTRAEEASRSKSEFLANMSHEIRTPLNGVVAMADALSRRALDGQEREMVEIIRSSGVTLERLLSDILDSAKIEAGQVTLETVVFNVRDAVRDIAALWGPKAEEAGIALVTEIDPVVIATVSGDVVRVRQILANLVSNAIKFTAEGGVRLTVAPTDDGLIRFTVTDTGVGFDDDQKDRIFSRFHQADGSITRRFGGTGLGLAISRDLAEMMGGTLDCHAVPGEGATFWFELPLPPADAADMVEAAHAVELEPRALRILLADDHPANRKVVEVLLAPTGAELVMVENGQQAVDAYAADPFDLVLMDMQMPVMDGLAATAAIRALETETGRARTPVIMLTANAMAEHVAQGREAGADGHLAKPITTASLFDAIGSVLADEDEAEAEAA